MGLFTDHDTPLSNAYKEGIDAFMSGRDFWECPHVGYMDAIEPMSAWLSGWMWAKQEKERRRKAEDQEIIDSLK